MQHLCRISSIHSMFLHEKRGWQSPSKNWFHHRHRSKAFNESGIKIGFELCFRDVSLRRLNRTMEFYPQNRAVRRPCCLELMMFKEPEEHLREGLRRTSYWRTPDIAGFQNETEMYWARFNQIHFLFGLAIGIVQLRNAELEGPCILCNKWCMFCSWNWSNTFNS